MRTLSACAARTESRPGAAARRAAAIIVAVVLACAGLTAAAQTGAASAGDEGKQIFLQGAQPSCAVCHTLADAGSTGNIGPNLDELKADATRVRRAVKEGIGNMPPFGATLSDAQIDAVSRYVARAAGGG